MPDRSYTSVHIGYLRRLDPTVSDCISLQKAFTKGYRRFRKQDFDGALRSLDEVACQIPLVVSKTKLNPRSLAVHPAL